MADIIRRAFAWGCAGALIGPAFVYSLMLIVLYRDPRCAPDGTGMCQLDIGINLTLGVIFGFVAFFIFNFVRGLLNKNKQADS